MKRLTIIITLILFLVFQGLAFNKVGTTAAQFLKIEVGARALGMGGCFGAIANDASALYWNPAGIAQLDFYEVTFTHTRWIADISTGFVGAAVPLGGTNAIGIQVKYLTMDEMEQTTIDQPKGTGLTFAAQDFALGVTYARAMTNFVHFGITAKMIHQQIWNEKATGYAIDLGLMLNTGIRGIKLGMIMTNFGTDMKLDGRDLIRGYDQMPDSKLNPDTEAKLSTEAWPLPTNLRISIASDIIGGAESLMQSSKTRLTAIAELMHPNDNPEHYNFGMEFAYNEMFFLRGGYRGNTDEEGLTAGAGLRLPLSARTRVVIDFAYADFGIFNNVQHFTVGIQF